MEVLTYLCNNLHLFYTKAFHPHDNTMNFAHMTQLYIYQFFFLSIFYLSTFISLSIYGLFVLQNTIIQLENNWAIVCVCVCVYVGVCVCIAQRKRQQEMI